MFTGLVHHTGTIQAVSPMPTGIKLTLDSKFNDLQLGESIAIDGACLTVTATVNSQFTVELSTETLLKTIAATYQPQKKVNLERALKMSDRLGGHFVSGHVDQVAKVASLRKQGDFYELVLTGISKKNQKYLVDKGSLTVNGVSLTLNKLCQDHCHLMLIPHTLEVTNLSEIQEASKVNLEYDLLAKLVARQITGGNTDVN